MSRALLLVAHPDDEVFFAGATLMKSPHTWDVVCLTHGEDERGAAFCDSIATLKRLGADIDVAALLGQGDPSNNPVPPAWWYEGCRDAVGALVVPHIYDVILTHNRMGEYGHPHHVAANRIARSLHTNVWEFWHTLGSGVGPQWRGEHTTAYAAEPEKAEALGCYGEELLAFAAHYPDLARHVASGLEQVTGDGRWR